MTGSTPLEEKPYVNTQSVVKTEKRQDDLTYFLTEMLMSKGGNGGQVCSSPQNYPRQREIDNLLPLKTNLGIRDRMGKTKGLAKSCSKRYYMERCPTSLMSYLGSQTCKIQCFISFSE